MPLAAADLHICRIDDGVYQGGSAAIAPAPAPLRRVWLVLTLCPHCNHRTGRYCSSHDTRGKRH